MKKVIFILIASIFFALNMQSQDTIGNDLNLKINVKTENVKMPITDINGLYNDIEELKQSVKDYKDNTTTQYSALSSKMDNIMYKNSETKVVYLGDSFGITKDDIKTAVGRSNKYTIIAILLPILAVLILWRRLYKFKESNAKTSILWASLSLLVALVTGGLIKLALESIFNTDMALLDNLQKLL